MKFENSRGVINLFTIALIYGIVREQEMIFKQLYLEILPYLNRRGSQKFGSAHLNNFSLVLFRFIVVIVR